MTAVKQPQSVDGARLLDTVHRMIVKYVAFPSTHHYTVVVLWILHTWTVHAFYVTPRLILDSAEPGSGKTRVLELLALLCRSAKLTLSTTTAALYRRLAAAEEAGQPPLTVLQDEADAIFGKTVTPQAEDLRALYNSGYRRGATVDRCEGDASRMRVREFPVWSPVALAGLAGRMPDTITSRGVTLHMRRRRPDQNVADFRERDAKVEAAPIVEILQQWADTKHDALSASRPPMPRGVTDRPAEIWEPLLAVANEAGGEWPARARAACTYFVVDAASDDEKLSLGQRLLRDLRELLAREDVTAMWSSEIITKLCSDPESEWRDLWGKSLDQRRLAKELGRYGVKPKTVRIGLATSRGYDTEGVNGLGQAWVHWLAPDAADTSETANTSQLNAVPSVSLAVVADTLDTHPTQPFIASDQGRHESVSAVSDVSHTSRVPSTGDVAAEPTASVRTVCSACERAPAKPGSDACDFCTAKRERFRISL